MPLEGRREIGPKFHSKMTEAFTRLMEVAFSYVDALYICCNCIFMVPVLSRQGAFFFVGLQYDLVTVLINFEFSSLKCATY